MLRFCSPLFCLLLLTKTLNAQQYQPMLSDTKEWLVKTCEFGNCLFDYYWAEGDTSIAGKDYKFLDGYHYNRNFLLREDIALRKVYALINLGGQQNEYLLYDFSMQSGDSIYISNPLSPAIGDAGYYHLDSVDTDTFEGQSRRVFHLSARDTSNENQYTRWIEGIGGTSILNAPGELGDTTKLAELLCVSENGQKIYSRYPDDTCYSNPALEMPAHLPRSEVSAYFSVESQRVHYSVDRQGYTLKLFSIQGVLLQSEPLKAGRGRVSFTGGNRQTMGLILLIAPDGKTEKSLKVFY